MFFPFSLYVYNTLDRKKHPYLRYEHHRSVVECTPQDTTSLKLREIAYNKKFIS